MTITADSLAQIDQHDNFTRAVSRRYRDRGQRQENPDRAKNQSDCKIDYRALLGGSKIWHLLKQKLFLPPTKTSRKIWNSSFQSHPKIVRLDSFVTVLLMGSPEWK